ncbi:MAG: PH domain-containing protein [Candidatus Berkelbacteria bacterium]
MSLSINSIPGHEKDHVIVITRRHIASMIKPIFMSLVMFLMPIFIISVLKSLNPEIFSTLWANILTIFGSIYYLVFLSFFFTTWISYYYNVFVITDNEVIDIDQSGLFDRRITEISLLRIQDVSARVKGLLPTLFNYGDLIAESAGENTRTYVVESIPDPASIADKILDLHNEHIAKEERIGEAAIADGDFRGGLIVRNKSLISTGQVDTTKSVEKECVCPPPPICPPLIESRHEVKKDTVVKEGDISNDDLAKGGEIKF